jgi:hypothetical protein
LEVALLPPRLEGRELEREVAVLPPRLAELDPDLEVALLPPRLEGREVEREVALLPPRLEGREVEREVALLPPRLEGREVGREVARLPPLFPVPLVREDETSVFIRFEIVARVVSRGRESRSFAEEPPVRRPALVGRLESLRRVALGRDPPDPEFESPERAFCRVPDSLGEEPEPLPRSSSVRGFERSDPASEEPLPSRPLERGRVGRGPAASLDEFSRGAGPLARSPGVRALEPSRVVRGRAMLS